MAVDAMYMMTPNEVAWGYLVGHIGTLPPPRDASLSPRHALEAVVLEGLLRPPCGVAFSGGRDSSTVLAVATHVARREGLPEPIPITRVFPDAPATDENSWQEMVLRHLNVREWARIELRDEFDMIGPLAQSIFLENGVVWPPTLYVHIPVIKSVSGGALLDGEGGDEVLDVVAHRIAPIARFLNAPLPLRWSRVRSALGTAAPRSIRRRYSRRRMQSRLPMKWLRPGARNSFLDSVADNESIQPWSFAASVRRVPRRRTQVYLALNRGLLARQHLVEASSPLLHPEFVHAIARAGGRLGWSDRTTALRALVPDLLPDSLLARTSKVDFRNAVFTRRTVEFAESWSGQGLDNELVDPAELRTLWLSGRGNALTTALLQTAWLADQARDNRSVADASEPNRHPAS